MKKVNEEMIQSRDKTFYTQEGYKKCQICGSPIERIEYPHVHYIEDRLVDVEVDWETKMSFWLQTNLWSL